MLTIAQSAADRSRPPAEITTVAWYPANEMSFADWAKQGRRLGLMGRSAGWWIGDWLAYGNAAYGERYARAARITGYDSHTLRNMVYVASHIDPSRRRDNLSWSHHAEVVALSEEAQEHWLGRAVQEGLSHRDLRQAIRDERRGLSERAQETVPDLRTARASRHHDPHGHGQPVVCPYCGQNFLPAEEQKVGAAGAQH